MITPSELSEIAESLKKIEPTKENLFLIKQLNTQAQKIMMITGIKLGEIYAEEDRMTQQNRNLTFSYERDFHYERKEEFGL